MNIAAKENVNKESAPDNVTSLYRKKDQLPTYVQ